MQQYPAAKLITGTSLLFLDMAVVAAFGRPRCYKLFSYCAEDFDTAAGSAERRADK